MAKEKENGIMPRGKHVKLIIGVDGSCSVDAINFTGPSCQTATQEITVALGGQVGHQHMKPESRIRQRCEQRERENA
jgi:hypothetical protein